MRQKPRFHGLKAIDDKIKVRASWNKYNLYNLHRLRKQNIVTPTFYQQKWRAKSLSRAYHGEFVREKQWQKMFRPWTHAVIPIDPTELAKNDGSTHSEGRGSGKDRDPSLGGLRKQKPIPYMSMVYAPLERRLDFAVFRALFASSARQARQFVIHGAVKVNGRKMLYPGYLLNPGDMFQVDPERVMFATGARIERFQLRERRRMKKGKKKLPAEKASPTESAADEPGIQSVQVEESQEEGGSAGEDGKEGEEEEEEEEGEAPTEAALRKEIFQKRDRALDLLKLSLARNKELSGKRKSQIRALKPQIMELCKSAPPSELIKTIDDQLADLLVLIENPSRSSPASPRGQAEAEEEPNTPPRDNYVRSSERQLKSRILQRVEELRENPFDASKPYATPWRPRPWMAPFAFIPRYLEVNQNVCAAVYLRHPVARPGESEVPSPFAPDTSQLAFTWYLRRR